MRIQQEVVDLLNETHPGRRTINHSIVTNIESKYRNFGHVRFVDNPHSTLNQVTSDFNVRHQFTEM